jgi:hypothetical protein
MPCLVLPNFESYLMADWKDTVCVGVVPYLYFQVGAYGIGQGYFQINLWKLSFQFSIKWLA